MSQYPRPSDSWFLLLAIPAIWLHSSYFLFSQFRVYDNTLSFYPSFFPGHEKIARFEILTGIAFRASFRLTSIQPLLWFFYTLVIFILTGIGIKLIPHPYCYIYLVLLFIIRAIINAIVFYCLTTIVHPEISTLPPGSH